jgi:hypothetical protein
MPLLNEEKPEEDKDFALRWYKVRNRVRDDFGQRPDINAILFLIGMNEVGIVKEVWEKEDKQNKEEKMETKKREKAEEENKINKIHHLRLVFLLTIL